MKKDCASFPTSFELLDLLILKISKGMPLTQHMDNSVVFKHLVIIYTNLYEVLLSFQFVDSHSLNLSNIITYCILFSSKKPLIHVVTAYWI